MRHGREGSRARVSFQARCHCGRLELNPAGETRGTRVERASGLSSPTGEGAGVSIHQFPSMLGVRVSVVLWHLLCGWQSELQQGEEALRQTIAGRGSWKSGQCTPVC